MPRSINELKIRRMVCDSLIRYLAMECADDPRQPDAIEYYRKQQAKLDAELAEAEKLERQRLGIPEPQPIVINLQTAVLFPKSEKVR